MKCNFCKVCDSLELWTTSIAVANMAASSEADKSISATWQTYMGSHNFLRSLSSQMIAALSELNGSSSKKTLRMLGKLRVGPNCTGDHCSLMHDASSRTPVAFQLRPNADVWGQIILCFRFWSRQHPINP